MKEAREAREAREGERNKRAAIARGEAIACRRANTTTR